jgi:predicted RND superfamily exporter protein
MVRFAIARPKTVIGAAVIITILFGSQLPKITTDTDPKHMLPITSPVRQYNNQVHQRLFRFALEFLKTQGVNL